MGSFESRVKSNDRNQSQSPPQAGEGAKVAGEKRLCRIGKQSSTIIDSDVDCIERLNRLNRLRFTALDTSLPSLSLLGKAHATSNHCRHACVVGSNALRP